MHGSTDGAAVAAILAEDKVVRTYGMFLASHSGAEQYRTMRTAANTSASAAQLTWGLTQLDVSEHVMHG